MKTSETLKYAGEVSVKKLEIAASNGFRVDIRGQAIQINVYEDIFSPFCTMSIVVKESLDIITALPLRGEEYLLVDIATPTFSGNKAISGLFYIYKLSDRTELSNKSIAYTLHAISSEAILDLNTKKSKAYSGRISDIAYEIVKSDGLDTSKNISVEQTRNATKYISNFWSPVKNLNYLASLAKSSTNNSAAYCFFENRNGFNFVSLETLYTAPVYQSFIKDDYVRSNIGVAGSSILDPNEDYRRISSFRVNTVYDSLNNIRTGTYGSKLISYDFLKKQYFVNDFMYTDEFRRSTHLNGKSLISESRPVMPLNAIFTQYRHFGMYNGIPDTTGTRTFQKRLSAIQSLQSNTIEIKVIGRTDYTVGQKVSLTIPRTQAVGEKDNSRDHIDTTYSGNYIIVALNHNIGRDQHEVTLELAKESYTG